MLTEQLCFVASTAGGAASSRGLGGLISRATGSRGFRRAAGSRCFSRLVRRATGSTAGSGLFLRLVGSAASGSGGSVLVPSGQVRKCHDNVLLGCCQRFLLSATIIIRMFEAPTSTHLFITESPFCNLWTYRDCCDILHSNISVTSIFECYLITARIGGAA